ncbi:UTRA domain-containing protein [Paraburkholderia xenovorans]|uniref:UTRA domain-containing protein n=1 Tax=Paraburkholderia xenovorans TaxID=36873 RepID=UPI0038BB0256
MESRRPPGYRESEIKTRIEATVDLKTAPVYEQIKSYVRECITTGAWKPGDLISSENELAKQFGVARMTVARALRELANSGLVTRRQGTGTFVATPRHESTLAEILSIDEEIRSRGRRYSAKVLSLDPTDEPAALTSLRCTSKQVYHSRIVHFEDGVPIQYEDRYVHPKLFPHYLSQDFTKQTPGSYMILVAPVQRVEFKISAQVPNVPMRRRLQMENGDPCLVLWQRAWVGDQIATAVNLWHPAPRFEFSGQASYR